MKMGWLVDLDNYIFKIARDNLIFDIHLFCFIQIKYLVTRNKAIQSEQVLIHHKFELWVLVIRQLVQI